MQNENYKYLPVANDKNPDEKLKRIHFLLTERADIC